MGLSHSRVFITFPTIAQNGEIEISKNFIWDRNINGVFCYGLNIAAAPGNAHFWCGCCS